MPSFLRGLLKIQFTKNVGTTEELKQEISAAVINVSEETLVALARNFRQLQMVMDADGAYTENVFM
jgi:post-segregation antitoxin (ccd killing protein)